MCRTWDGVQSGRCSIAQSAQSSGRCQSAGRRVPRASRGDAEGGAMRAHSRAPLSPSPSPSLSPLLSSPFLYPFLSLYPLEPVTLSVTETLTLSVTVSVTEPVTLSVTVSVTEPVTERMSHDVCFVARARRAASVRCRLAILDSHAAIAFSATTGWYRRPSEHLTHPRSPPFARTMRQVSTSRPYPSSRASTASSSGSDAAGIWCHATHHEMTAARNASASGVAARSLSRSLSTSNGM